jgi:hypothetical protein
VVASAEGIAEEEAHDQQACLLEVHRLEHLAFQDVVPAGADVVLDRVHSLVEGRGNRQDQGDQVEEGPDPGQNHVVGARILALGGRWGLVLALGRAEQVVGVVHAREVAEVGGLDAVDLPGRILGQSHGAQQALDDHQGQVLHLKLDLGLKAVAGSSPRPL